MPERVCRVKGGCIFPGCSVGWEDGFGGAVSEADSEAISDVVGDSGRRHDSGRMSPGDSELSQKAGAQEFRIRPAEESAVVSDRPPCGVTLTRPGSASASASGSGLADGVDMSNMFKKLIKQIEGLEMLGITPELSFPALSGRKQCDIRNSEGRVRATSLWASE